MRPITQGVALGSPMEPLRGKRGCILNRLGGRQLALVRAAKEEGWQRCVCCVFPQIGLKGRAISADMTMGELWCGRVCPRTAKVSGSADAL